MRFIVKELPDGWAIVRTSDNFGAPVETQEDAESGAKDLESGDLLEVDLTWFPPHQDLADALGKLLS